MILAIDMLYFFPERITMTFFNTKALCSIQMNVKKLVDRYDIFCQALDKRKEFSLIFCAIGRLSTLTAIKVFSLSLSLFF